MHIAVTGGAGYIGSHTCVELLARGHRVAIIDTLVNSHPVVPERIEAITGVRPPLHRVDIRDHEALVGVLGDGLDGEPFDAVIHFAGLKAVGESVRDPLAYWDVNVSGSLSLLRAMHAVGCRRLVFSSSATVYGEINEPPFVETMPTAPTNPYGRTKLAVERMLMDLEGAGADWSVSILRYFNPVGAHASGTIGEDPADVPNNLMPYIAQVAVGRRETLSVFGDDYDTPDGTGVRDYIHVVDLARGHLSALEYLVGRGGVHVHNLGTGRGHSVLEVVAAFVRASNRAVPHQVVARRPGDIPAAWADTTRASSELGWRSEHDLDEMCRDAWRWQSGNPDGYGAR